MQNILLFNTVFKNVSLILKLKNDTIIQKIEEQKQSEILVSSIKKILNENNVNYSDIDIFTSIIGPGNFTGIKTSLAVLKALKITTKAKIITCDVFEIISFNMESDIVILDMGTVKYFIQDKQNYYTIYKKDIEDFLSKNISKKIITNEKNIKGKNIIYSEFTDEKWVEVINNKIQKNIFTDNIEALYIEEAGITKRKK